MKMKTRIHPAGMSITGVAALIAPTVALLIASVMWGCPRYAVYSQTLRGEATLKEAEYSKRVAVQEAQAKKDSAVLLGEAEVSRATGTAEANRILGESLKGNEAYLRYLWIENLHTSTNERIYIPTEAGLPILEARPAPVK
jgi:regulator of protease activity HflC (stomatin/prohibitin superfamily)